MRDVEGRVAFITGGDSGIGLGIARVFVKAGMNVAITYRSKSHLDESMKLLESAGTRVHALRVDVTDRAAMATAAAETARVFGKIHVLVNNAGVAPTTSLSNATFADWDWCVGVNLNGVFNGVHTFLPYLKEHTDGGQIVTTASIFGLAIFRFSQGVYSTTKFAVVGMMEALRSELASSNIGVSVCCPGPVRSNMADCDRNRPDVLREAGQPDPGDQAAIEAAIGALPENIRNSLESAMADPLEVGERVLCGIRNNDLYILTHREYRQTIRDRYEAILASLPGSEGTLAEPRLAMARVLHNSLYSSEFEHRLTINTRSPREVPIHTCSYTYETDWCGS